MANYITKQPLNKGAALSADVQYLMPMVQSEIANIRKRNDMKIAAMENLKQQAQENPDDFRGTQFNFDSDGNMVMNDIAQKMGRVDRDQAIEQQGVNTTTETLDMDATKQATDIAGQALDTPERRQAAENQRNITAAFNPAQAVYDASRQQSYGGGALLDTAPNTTQGPSSATANTTTGTAPIAQISKTPIPFADGMRVATPQDYTQPTQPPTQAETAKDLADKTAATGVDIKIVDKESQSHSEGKSNSKNYSYETNTGVGDSSVLTDPVKNTRTEQIANIKDFDQSNVKQLRRAAGLERVRNLSLGGTPQAPIIGELADRLETREKFLKEIQGTYGMKTTTNTVSGGKVDLKQGKIEAGMRVQSGASSYTNYSNTITSGNNTSTVDNGPKNDPNDGIYSFDASKDTAGGEMKLVNGLVTNTGSADIYPAVNASHKSTLLAKNKSRIDKERIIGGYKYVTDIDTGLQFRVNAKTGEAENWVIKPNQGFKETDAPRVAGIGRGKHTQNVNEVKSTLIAKPPKGREKDFKEVRDEYGKLLGYEEL